MTVPLIRDEAVVGVINVEAPWMSAFSIADYERLTKLAALAAEAMPGIAMSTPAVPGDASPPAG